MLLAARWCKQHNEFHAAFKSADPFQGPSATEEITEEFSTMSACRLNTGRANETQRVRVYGIGVWREVSKQWLVKAVSHSATSD